MKHIFLVLLLLLMFSPELWAQCAMCKAAATSNIESDANQVGKGLNTGILYLMTVPYLLLGALFFFMFKEKILSRLKSLI
jgi:hypothetical protein